MSLCLNDRQSRLRVPSSIDLLPEIDRITSRQAEGIGLHLVLAERRYTCARVTGDGSGQPLYGKYELKDLTDDLP